MIYSSTKILKNIIIMSNFMQLNNQYGENKSSTILYGFSTRVTYKSAAFNT